MAYKLLLILTSASLTGTGYIAAADTCLAQPQQGLEMPAEFLLFASKLFFPAVVHNVCFETSVVISILDILCRVGTVGQLLYMVIVYST